MIERKSWIENQTLEGVLLKRDQFELGSSQWDGWNQVKADWLEHNKPSIKEDIVYFESDALNSISDGFSFTESMPMIPYDVMNRSILEYHPAYRHPIPYVIIRHKKRYFFILRKSGSGEQFLIGLMGMVGGHVGAEDVDELSLNKTILNALRRELNEEVGVDESSVRSIDIKGLIKGSEGVDAYHLGIIYEIELETDDIVSQEEGVIEGIWLHENELPKYVDRFESWAKIVYENLLKK